MQIRKGKQTIKAAKRRAERMDVAAAVQREAPGRGAKRAGVWVR